MIKNAPKIAVLTRLFPNIVQTYILNHITGIINLGVNTAVIAEHNPQQDVINPVIEEYKLIDKTIYVKIGVSTIAGLFRDSAYFTQIIKLMFSRIWFHFGAKYGLLSLFRVAAISKSNCKLVHSHSLSSSYNFLFIREYLRIPLIVTYHGKVPRGVDKLPENKTRNVISKTDIFIVNTEFAKSELVDLGCPAGKIRIIPQGTDINKFSFSERKVKRNQPIKLLTVARLSAEKGHHTAINAIAKLVSDYPEIEYHIVGRGPEKDSIIKQTDKLGLSDHVFIHNFMTGDALLNMFADVHIFILPSIDFEDGYLVETQGVVLQESQASGIPVIGSNAGGIPDVVHDNETGLIFEQENHSQLADKIKLLIDDESLYQQLCRAGRSDVENHFSIPIVCSQLVSVYEELLGTCVTTERKLFETRCHE